MKAPKRFIYERPPLYPKQEAALFTPARYGLIEASTKSGKTVGAMAWLFEQAVRGRSGDNFWWVAPVSAQAAIAFDRFKKDLPQVAFTANETHKMLTIVNGTRIWFKSGDRPDSLFGEDVCAAVMDEATRCKEDAWHAIRTTLTATKGPVRIISNVKGRNNWAYRMARRAEAGDPDMHYAKITARDLIDAGMLSADELADAERHLPAPVFRELYYAEASDDQGNPFGLAAIRRCRAPLSSRNPVVWGWDLAKHIDWTVGVALDEEGVVCRFERRQGTWEQIFETIVTLTGDVSALVDSTGVGDPIVDRLQRVSGGMFQGFHFSAPTKQQLMEGLAVTIQQQRVRFPDGPITAELETFEYEFTRTGVHYCAPEGLHDDCVCALALAVRLYAMEFDREPLRLLTGSDQSGARSGIARMLAFLSPRVSADWRLPE
jgi:hypothetical protein